MASRNILISQRGPLPINMTVEIENDGDVMLFLSGSVWSEKANTQIGIKLLVDNVELGGGSIFSNRASEHRAIVPVFFQFTLDKEWPSPTQPPKYTFSLLPGSDTTIGDINDYYQLTIVD